MAAYANPFADGGGVFGPAGTWPSPTGSEAVTMTSFDYSAALSSIYGLSPQTRADQHQQQNGMSNIAGLQPHLQSRHDNIYQSFSAAPYTQHTAAYTLPPVAATSPPFPMSLSPEAASAQGGVVPQQQQSPHQYQQDPHQQQHVQDHAQFLHQQLQEHLESLQHHQQQPQHPQHPYEGHHPQQRPDEQHQLPSLTSFYTPYTAERIEAVPVRSTAQDGERLQARITPSSSVHVREQKAQKAVTIGKATTVESFKGSNSTFEVSQAANGSHATREPERPSTAASEHTASARRASVAHPFVPSSYPQRSQSLISPSLPRQDSVKRSGPLVHRNGSTYTVARPDYGSRLPRLSSPPSAYPQRPVRTLSSPIKPLKCAAMRLQLHKLFREPGPKRLGRDVLVQQNQDTLIQEHLPVSSATYDGLPMHHSVQTQPYTTGWTPQQHYIGHPEDWSFATRVPHQSPDPAHPELDYSQSMDTPRDIWNVPYSSAIPEDGSAHATGERAHSSAHLPGPLMPHTNAMRNVSGNHQQPQQTSPSHRLRWAKRVFMPLRRRVESSPLRSSDERAWNDYFPEILESDRVHFVDGATPQQDHMQPGSHAPAHLHIHRKAAPRVSALSTTVASPQHETSPPCHSVDNVASLQSFLKLIQAGPDLLQHMPSASQSYSSPRQDGMERQYYSMEHVSLPPPAQPSSHVPSQISVSQAYGGMAQDNVWPPSATQPSSTAPTPTRDLRPHSEHSQMPQMMRTDDVAQQTVTANGRSTPGQDIARTVEHVASSSAQRSTPQPEATGHRRQSSSVDDAHLAEVRHVKRVAPRAALSSPPPSHDKRHAIYDPIHANYAKRDSHFNSDNEVDGASLSQHRSETTQEWRYVRNRAAEKYRDWIERSAIDLSNGQVLDRKHGKAGHARHMHVIQEVSPRTSDDTRHKRGIKRPEDGKRHATKGDTSRSPAPPVPPKSPRPDTRCKSRQDQRVSNGITANQTGGQISACSTPVDAKELEAKLSKLVEADKSSDVKRESLEILQSHAKPAAVQSVESNLTGSRGFAKKMLPTGQNAPGEELENLQSTFETTQDRDVQTSSQLQVIDVKTTTTDRGSAAGSTPSRRDQACSAMAVSPLLSRIPTLQHLAPDKVAKPANGVDLVEYDQTHNGAAAAQPAVLESEVVAKLHCTNGNATPRAYSLDLMPAFDSWTSAYRADDEIPDDATSDRSLYLEAKLELQQRVNYWQDQVKRNQRRLLYAPSAATSVPSSALRGPIRGEGYEKRMSHLTSISRRDNAPLEVKGQAQTHLNGDHDNFKSLPSPRAHAAVLKETSAPQNGAAANGKPKAEMTFKGSPSQFIDLIIDSIKLADTLVGSKEVAGEEKAAEEGRKKHEMAEHAKRESSTLPKVFMESRACGNAKVDHLVDLDSVVESHSGTGGTRHIQPLSEELSMQLFGDFFEPPPVLASGSGAQIAKLKDSQTSSQPAAGTSCESRPLDRDIRSMSSLDSAPKHLLESSSDRPLFQHGHRLRRIPNVSELRRVSNEEERNEASPIDLHDDENGLVSSSTGQDYHSKPQTSPDGSFDREQVADTPSAAFIDQFTRKLDAYIESAGDVTHLHKALVRLHHELLEKMTSSADVAVLEHRLSSLEKAFFIPQSQGESDPIASGAVTNGSVPPQI